MSDLSELVNRLASIPFEAVLFYYKIPIEKSRGDRLFIFCPFHDETKPSFLVGGKGNFGYCFGCGESWDVIRFIQKKENVSYIQAVKKLAEISGIYVSDDELKLIETKNWSRWKKLCGSSVEQDSMREKNLKKVALRLAQEFTKFYQQNKDWKWFHCYVDFCWEEFDKIFESGTMTPEKLDQLKLWFQNSKKLIASIAPYFENFNHSIREFYFDVVDGL